MLRSNYQSRAIRCQADTTERLPASRQQPIPRQSSTSAHKPAQGSQNSPQQTKASTGSTTKIKTARTVRTGHAGKNPAKARKEDAVERGMSLADVQQQYKAELVSAPFTGTGGHLVLHSKEIRYANTPKQAKAWLIELLQLASTASEPVLVGFDTETPVTRTRGVYKQTALMQLCYHHPSYEQAICLLIPIDRLGFTAEVQAVLSHKRIIKIGMALAEDMLRLQRDSPVASRTRIRSMLDLSWLAYACFTPKPCSAAIRAPRMSFVQQTAEPNLYQESWSMAGLMQEVTQFTISKNSRVRCSNWAARPLTDKQVSYAAADAYAGLVLYYSLWLRWLQVKQQLQQPAPNRSRDGSGDSDLNASLKEQAAVQDSSEGSEVSVRLHTKSSSKSQEQLNQNLLGMEYTLHSQWLTQPQFWDNFLPAVAMKRQWQSEVLHAGMHATVQQLKRLRTNMAVKLDLAILQLGASLNHISPPEHKEEL